MKAVTSILVAVLLSSVFFSCEEDYVPIVENTDIPLISRIRSLSDTATEYEYNAENLVIEERSKYFFTKHRYNDRNQVVLTQVYSDENLLSSSWEIAQEAANRTEWVTPDNTPLTSSQTYGYSDSGILVSVNNHRRNGYTDHSELSYDANGRISRHTYFWEEKISVYFDYQYDEKGNVIKTSKYWVPLTGDPILTFTYEFEYDDKFNPFKAFNRLILPGIYGVNTNENNIIRETYTVHADFLSSESHVTEFSYDYNAQGYPVKKGDALYEYKE